MVKMETVECLIENQAQIDIPTYVIHLFYTIFFNYVRLNTGCQMGHMPIHFAAYAGSLRLLKDFIMLSVDVNVKTKVSILKIDKSLLVLTYHPL